MQNKFKVSDCTPVPSFNVVKGSMKVEIGDEVWVKGIVEKIDVDGDVTFESPSPINGCLFRKTYSNVELIINKK